MTQEDKDKALRAAELLYGNDEKAKRAFISGYDYSIAKYMTKEQIEQIEQLYEQLTEKKRIK